MAQLHNETLTDSFLARLGLDFLNKLYVFLIIKEKVWVYVENNEVKGFVSFSENSAGMMKRFLLNCPGCIALLILKIITHPDNFKRFWETFRAPFKSGKSKNANNSIFLPPGELLSISVKADCQSSGIGSLLLMTLEDYLFQNHILHYKVVAGDELEGANKFYLKNGFSLASQIRIHGEKLSNVYHKVF